MQNAFMKIEVPHFLYETEINLFMELFVGPFLLRLFSRLFNRLLLKMKFVGRSCLFSFHGSLALYLPVALLNRMVF